jgi:hypothetical protein
MPSAPFLARCPGRLGQEAACPVILLLHTPDPAFVKEASKRGIFACITDAEVDDWQSAIDIVLRRFTEYHDLEGAFGRRAVTERAKGILMERHSVDDACRLRDAARAIAPGQHQARRRRGRRRRGPSAAAEAAAHLVLSRLGPRTPTK